MISPTAISVPLPAEVTPSTKPTNRPSTAAATLSRVVISNRSRSCSSSRGMNSARLSTAVPVNITAAATAISIALSNDLP